MKKPDNYDDLPDFPEGYPLPYRFVLTATGEPQGLFDPDVLGLTGDAKCRYTKPMLCSLPPPIDKSSEPAP